MTIKWVFFVFLVALVTVISAQRNRNRDKPKVPEVDQQCLECICQGSSNCDTTIKCHNAGANAYFCGPYIISWAYWHDSGRPGDKGRAHDFETCLNNKTCAEESVRGYMRKHGQDCDQDGTISCYDFARIHKLGYGDCGSNSIENTDYWDKFLICYQGYLPGEGDHDVPPNYDYGDGNLDARRQGS